MSVKSFKTSGVGVDLAPKGLVLINTTSFSAVASQSINDVFSATYNHYKIIGFAIGTTTAALNLRLRVAGADDSTSNYDTERLEADGTSVTAARASAGTSAQFSAVRSTANNNFDVTLFNPFATEQTNFIAQGFDPIDNALIRNHFGRFRLTTSFTGITVIAGAGTMTGSISVYGFNK